MYRNVVGDDRTYVVVVVETIANKELGLCKQVFEAEMDPRATISHLVFLVRGQDAFALVPKVWCVIGDIQLHICQIKDCSMKITVITFEVTLRIDISGVS